MSYVIRCHEVVWVEFPLLSPPECLGNHLLPPSLASHRVFGLPRALVSPFYSDLFLVDFDFDGGDGSSATYIDVAYILPEIDSLWAFFVLFLYLFF